MGESGPMGVSKAKFSEFKRYVNERCTISPQFNMMQALNV